MQPSFRAQVVERARRLFGEPEVSTVESGELYRWTLTRTSYMNLHLTIDSPEYSNIAHIMISDGPRHQPEPVESVNVYTMGEAEQVLQRVLAQWKEAAV